MKVALLVFCAALIAFLGLSRVDLRMSLGSPEAYLYLEFPRALEHSWLVLDFGQMPKNGSK